MNHLRRALLLAGLLGAHAAIAAEPDTPTAAAPAAAPAAIAADSGGVDIDAFVKTDTFLDIKLSPTGEFYAASVPIGDETSLVVFTRADMKMAGSFRLGKNNHVSDFEWVSPTRILIGMAQKLGSRDEPQPTGEIYAMNANGTGIDALVGYRLQVRNTGTRIQPKKMEAVAAYLVDGLPDDDKRVVISVQQFSADAYTRAEHLDVYTGRRNQITIAPVRNARYYTDNAGVVRFALGYGTDNVRKLFYRGDDQAEWELLRSDERDQRMDTPIGFSGDNRIAYLRSEMAEGPDAIVAYDTDAKTRKEVLRDKTADPARVIYRTRSQEPVGVFYYDGRPRTAFFDKNSPEARQYRSLEAAFPGEAVRITSQTADGKLSLVQVWSDRNPGDVFLFDNDSKHAQHTVSRRAWFDPAKMAPVRAISLRARDGLELSGLLTTPAGRDGKSLPLVVMPHGGPFGVQDRWHFDDDPQLLAAAGYAVLQVNFRGSGGYGRAFEQAGRREWGGKMQDDLTDATRWAIEQGIAERSRICLYGASYGGYASLMGVAREPELYRCAAGYVGVYDLPMMHSTCDIQQFGSGENYLRNWLGMPETLEKVSPTRMAGRIKVPVFLAAGGEDQRAPQAHSEKMEKALRQAGVPVETLYYKTEGHGFYEEAHRREFYARLLAFLSRSLGGKTAAPAKAATGK